MQAYRRIRLVLALLIPGFLVSLAQGQTEEKITESRKRGVEFLKFKQKPEGNWDFTGHDVGITALCTVASIENGIPLTDPVVQKGYEYVKKNIANLKDTYDLALAILCLSRMGDRRDKPQIKALAARLIAGQMDSGGWHYKCPGPELDAEKVLRDPSALPRPKEGYGDNSCTQFAVLGLWVASRSGVNIDRTLARVAHRFNTSQNDDGGWAYVKEAAGTRAGSTPSMTGAGLYCLAVAEAAQIREYLKSGKKSEGGNVPGKSLLEDKVFAKGLKRTGDFVQGLGTGSQRYFMWSVERVGVLLGLEKIGETEWFQKGADALLKTQKDDGGWPTAWEGADKDGLSDTCFALLFLRKANLGSDISRLLEGEHDQKFEIVGRKSAARFDTLEEAVAAAKGGETIRVDGPGPYKLGHLEITKDLTIQAGFGYAPVFKHEVGKNRLGIKLKPETDPNARDMLSIQGNVTLEGLKFQMDPTTMKQPIPWRVVTIKSGSVRLLNCTLSETNKQGTTGIIVESPGKLVVRNSLFVGGKAAIEFVAADKQELTFDNSVIFSNVGFVVGNDAKTKKPADLTLKLSNSVIQAKEVLQCPKLVGSVGVESRMCVFQADWIGQSLVASANDTKGRSWKGTLNLYDVKQWVGAGGKSAGDIKDSKDIRGWVKFWGNSETTSFARTAPFVGLRQVGNFSHEASPQDWQLELPPDADSLLQKSRIGVNSYLTGPGQPFDQYRETIAYTDWLKGKLEVTGLEGKADQQRAVADSH